MTSERAELIHYRLARAAESLRVELPEREDRGAT